jgi:hypothetical protein
LQRDGLTGHLTRISAWLDKKNNVWLTLEGKGENGWEEVPYWLKGYGDLAYILGDKTMFAETRTWIEGVFVSQRKDGFFGPYNEKDGKPDLWPQMAMLWAVQSYFEYTGDKRALTFMTSYFRWQNTLDEALLLKDFRGHIRAGDNLYSVYWLYNITGEAFLLELGEKINRNTANWRQADKLPTWHCVNIAQSFRQPAIYYLKSRDSSDLQAAYNNFRLVRERYGQVPGGMYGADENAREGYHDPRQGIETCAIVEQMASDEIMLRITGDPFWADHCEKVAFNAYPAAVMPDFKSLRNLTPPNHVLSDFNNHYPGIDNQGPQFGMNPLSYRCCQHNHTQGWPYYSENLWMASSDNGLLAALYAESTVTAKVGKGKKVILQQITKYPFESDVRIRLKEAVDAEFPLWLRIPEWCSEAEAVLKTVNADGARDDTVVKRFKGEPSKYIRIERKWTQGDIVELRLPMSITTETWAQNGNSVSINYGPLTFSLKINEKYTPKDSESTAFKPYYDSRWQKSIQLKDWPSYEITPVSPWNYGLSLNRQHPSKSFEIVIKPFPTDNFPFTHGSVPIELKAKGARLPSWKLDEHRLCGVVPSSPAETSEPIEDITLIPMGVARLRISAFPVLKN